MSVTLFFPDEQVQILREILDTVPLSERYLPFVVDLLQRLPESDAGAGMAHADSAPGSLSPQKSGRDFTLIPLTPRGASMVDAIDAVLARLPHGDSL